MARVKRGFTPRWSSAALLAFVLIAQPLLPGAVTSAPRMLPGPFDVNGVGGPGSAAVTPAPETSQSTPCCGGPERVPGFIEAVNYDAGGEGIAYHDSDPGNRGGSTAYRPAEGIDTLPSVEGGYQIGWTSAGEWLQYTVDVEETTDYSMQARVSSETGGAFHIEVDGVDVTGTLTVNTGQWDVYQSVSRIPIHLDAGRRVIRFVVDSNALNFLFLHIQKVIPKGSRLLGMDSANGPESGPPIDAFNRAQAAGAEATSLSVNWDQIEPAPNTYVDPWNLLATTNWFYPAHNSQVSLTIRPIDGNSKPVPADLRGVPFGDPVMIDRFNRMIVWVLQRMPNVTFASIQIGNEIDKNVGLDVAGYATFLYWANVQIKKVRPDIKVGYTASWQGLVQNPTRDTLLWLKPYVDVVGVTYYPLDNNLQVRHPMVVQGDFDMLMASYRDTTIFFEEVGYPTGPLCGSSEVKQNDFIQNVFAAWDSYATNIGYISFVRVEDWSPRLADSVASAPPYYLPYPAFSEFLRTLGFRTYPAAGQDKPAMTTLMREAAARGWN